MKIIHQCVQFLLEAHAQFFALFENLVFFKHFEHGQTSGTGERIARVGSTESTRMWRVHDVGAAGHGGEWQSSGEALGDTGQVWCHTAVFDGPHFTGASIPRLNLVIDEQNAVLVADVAQAAHERGWRWVKTALALNRFDDDRRHLIWRDLRVEQILETGECVFGCDATVRNWERRFVNLGRERSKILLVRFLLAGQTHTHQGATVKARVEADDARTVGVCPGNLDGVFGGFRTG